MSTMVERVAQAIYDKATTFDGDQIAVHLGHSCIIDMSSRNSEELRENVMSVCRDAARAAIEAMMEPTLEMKVAGELKFFEVSLGNGSTKVRTPALGEDHLASYARMIQAALKEQA